MLAVPIAGTTTTTTAIAATTITATISTVITTELQVSRPLLGKPVMNSSRGMLPLVALLVSCGGAPYQPPMLPPPPGPPIVLTPPEPPPPGAAEAQPPDPPLPAPEPAGRDVYAYPEGQWVHAAERGWVWVPAGTSAVEVEGVPYVYLYTLAFGWTWYVSPWGWGPYSYGVWVGHPWHPVGWRGYWLAPPHVVVGLGRGGHFRR